MPALTYRTYTRAKFTDPPFEDFVRYNWDKPVGSTDVNPVVWNYVGYPSPGTYTPPLTGASGGIVSYVANSTANTAVTTRNVVQFGDGVTTNGGEIQFRMDSFIDGMFTDNQRLGWTVEFWLWLDRTTMPGTVVPSLFHIGNGIPFTTVPLLEILYHGNNFSGTTDAGATVYAKTNGLLLRYGGKVYPCSVVATDLSAGDIGSPIAVELPKQCAGWHHCAVVESKLDNTIRMYVNGKQRAFITGVNITTPTFTVPYGTNTIVQYALAGNSSKKVQMANMTLHKYPKYLAPFTPPNLTNFTTP